MSSDEDADHKVDAVRSLLTSQELQAADSQMVRRYLRAVAGHPQQAARRLTATIRWRASQRPDLLRCSACASNPRAHYMHVVGFDRTSRPVIYSCNGMAQDKSADACRDHMLATFESAIQCMVAPGVEQWTWVMDFHGFSSADISIRLARSFLDISADHYPERLGHFLMVGAPRLFNVLWTAIEPFIDAKTRSKVTFLPYDVDSSASAACNPSSSTSITGSTSSSSSSHSSLGRLMQRASRAFGSSASQAQPQQQDTTSGPWRGSRLRAELEGHFDASLVEWLLQEMAENRDLAVAERKVHDPLRLQQQLQQLRQRHDHQQGEGCCRGRQAAEDPVVGPSASVSEQAATDAANTAASLSPGKAARCFEPGHSASRPDGRVMVRCASSKQSLSSTSSEDCRVCIDQTAALD